MPKFRKREVTFFGMQKVTPAKIDSFALHQTMLDIQERLRQGHQLKKKIESLIEQAQGSLLLSEGLVSAYSSSDQLADQIADVAMTSEQDESAAVKVVGMTQLESECISVAPAVAGSALSSEQDETDVFKEKSAKYFHVEQLDTTVAVHGGKDDALLYEDAKVEATSSEKALSTALMSLLAEVNANVMYLTSMQSFIAEIAQQANVYYPGLFGLAMTYQPSPRRAFYKAGQARSRSRSSLLDQAWRDVGAEIIERPDTPSLEGGQP